MGDQRNFPRVPLVTIFGIPVEKSYLCHLCLEYTQNKLVRPTPKGDDYFICIARVVQG
jgi:hypothetical protein